jgi:hypothetical protein
MGGALTRPLTGDLQRDYRVHAAEETGQNEVVYLIHEPIDIDKLKQRVELVESIVSDEVKSAETLARDSINVAQTVPRFKLTVKLSMDDEMRKMYNSTVSDLDVERARATNVKGIEELLAMRNKALDLMNTNYLDKKIAEPSSEQLAEARNELSITK